MVYNIQAKIVCRKAFGYDCWILSWLTAEAQIIKYTKKED
jgi:hypothetical protein